MWLTIWFVYYNWECDIYLPNSSALHFLMKACKLVMFFNCKGSLLNSNMLLYKKLSLYVFPFAFGYFKSFLLHVLYLCDHCRLFSKWSCFKLFARFTGRVLVDRQCPIFSSSVFTIWSRLNNFSSIITLSMLAFRSSSEMAFLCKLLILLSWSFFIMHPHTEIP